MNPQTDLSQAIANLEKHSQQLHSQLQKNKVAKKFYTRSTLLAHQLREKSAQLLTGAGLIGTILATPMTSDVAPVHSSTVTTDTLDVSQDLSQKLTGITPHQPTNLDEGQAAQIEQVIQDTLGITAVAELEGQSLNHQVGYIGYEQHLKRYPGDTLTQHDDEQVAGIAPGLGAWGYFASSQSEFTTQDYLREKYYSVAQTLYLPNWVSDFAYLRDWYKYRKVLVVNPANGQAVVTVIGDAGPAEWTGKQFGGSPETMKALDLHLGSRKGLVLFLFIDDPDDLIPLGPVTQSLNLSTS